MEQKSILIPVKNFVLFIFEQRIDKSIKLKIRIIKYMILYIVIKIIYITKTLKTIIIKHEDNTEYGAFMSRCINNHRYVL